MAAFVSMNNQFLWAPQMHLSAKESSSIRPSCKRQEPSQQDRTEGSSQDGSRLLNSALSHYQVVSNDVITISSDEESDTDDEDNGVGEMHSTQPRESHPSTAASDASGGWDESYYGRTHDNPHQLPRMADDHTVTDPPADDQGPIQAEAINPEPPGSAANDPAGSPFRQFASLPQTPGGSSDTAPEQRDSSEAVLKSDDELCPPHQLKIREPNPPDYCDVIANGDGADGPSNVQRTSQSSPMLVPPGARSSDDTSLQYSNQQHKHSNASSNCAPNSLGFNRLQGGQTVEFETQPVDEGLSEDAATMDNALGRTRMPNPCDGGNKRRRPTARERVDEGSDSDGEFVPTRKLRKTGPHRRKQSLIHYRRPKKDATALQTRNRKKPLTTSRDQSMHTTIAGYEEWLLSDAVLKCIRDNGTMTFQMQFTHTLSPCGVHAEQQQQLKVSQPKAQPKGKYQSQNRTSKPKSYMILDESGALSPRQCIPVQPVLSDGSDDNADIYEVECILARWGKNYFLLKWGIDGSTGWEPRRNILDKEMLLNFESNYQGFDEGVDVLDARNVKSGKRQLLLHFHGRPQSEDSWVNEELLSPSLIEKVSRVGWTFPKCNREAEYANE